ncbi:hypothetical protein ACHAXS_008059 [Conticribra weissflogii]
MLPSIQQAAIDSIAMHPPLADEARPRPEPPQLPPADAAVAAAAAAPAPPREAAPPDARHDPFRSRAQVRRAVHGILGRLLRRSLANVQRREGAALAAMAAARRASIANNDGLAADPPRPDPRPAPLPLAPPAAPHRVPQRVSAVHPAMLLTPRQNRLLLLRQSFLFEDILYKRAVSLEEYLDRGTLEDRIFLVGRAVGRAWSLRVERQHQRQPGGRAERGNSSNSVRRNNDVDRRNYDHSYSGHRNWDRASNVGPPHDVAARRVENESGVAAVWKRGGDGSGRLVRSTG